MNPTRRTDPGHAAPAPEEVERALREQEARIRAILDSAHEAIITIDETGTIESVNPATERVFGYRSEELQGRNVRMLMPEPHRSRHDDYIRSYLETGRAKVIGAGRETVGLRKDGSHFPMDLSIGEMRVGERRAFTGIARDISARKEAEAHAQEALTALRRSRDDLLAILDQLRVGAAIVDEEGRIEFANAFCRIRAGLDRESALGTAWEEALPFDAPSSEALRRSMRTPPEQRTRISLTTESRGERRHWFECDVRDDPRDPRRRLLLLYDVSEVHDLRDQVDKSRFGQMVGRSRPMLRLYESFEKVAHGDWTVLIEGETGVGKELVARGIHAASPRRNGPFIAVNCAGLSESLLASQLFGHRRGSFTGAVADQEGLFEAASAGTLFLDEIGDIPLSVQTSLLRVLQEREITRLGETRARRVDVRVLAATHRNLAEEVEQGRFREDLLYRIRVARIRVPPLRERREDIPLLVSAFLAESRVSTGKPAIELGADVMRRLIGYAWPGNVRELKSAVEHAAIQCRGSVIQLADLTPELLDASPAPATAPRASSDERQRIETALDETGGNRSRAARLLGISRATLYRRLRELGIPGRR